MSDYAPSIKAARLFEKTSAKGNVYFTGRLGGLRVTLLKSGEAADDGSPIWHLMFAEAQVAASGSGGARQGDPSAAPSKRSESDARYRADNGPLAQPSARAKSTAEDHSNTLTDHDIIPF